MGLPGRAVRRAQAIPGADVDLDGLAIVKVRGEAARVLARGKGGALPDPPLPLDGVVTVQLQKVGEPLCVESTFAAAAQRRNTGAMFKATLP